MGADLILCAMPVDVSRETAIGNLAALSGQQIYDLLAFGDNYLTWDVNPSVDDVDVWADGLRPVLVEALVDIYSDDRRDLTLLTLDGRRWAFTGGNGDDPPDLFDLMVALSVLGVTVGEKS